MCVPPVTRFTQASRKLLMLVVELIASTSVLVLLRKALNRFLQVIPV
jgi:hypothetical protein